MTSKIVALLEIALLIIKFMLVKMNFPTEHLEANSDFNYEMIADGDTTKEVIDNQLEKIRANTSHIVLSIGGNDLLQKLYIMTNQTSGMVQALEIASKTVEEIKLGMKKFWYTKTLNRPVICTIYEGDLQSDPDLAVIEEAAKVLLSMMNDSIHFLGKKYDLEVLEFEIFLLKYDYANPIEPSHSGGENCKGDN